MYKCDECGKKVDDAYNRTLYFNGVPIIQTLCEDCIRKIGHDSDSASDSEGENGTSDSDNNNFRNTGIYFDR